MAGLYIHIPFCKQACHYCNFHFSTTRQLQADMVQAIAREITLQSEFLPSTQLSSIYFGGGTPSLLTAAQLDTLFNVIARHFTWDKKAEVTLEANPDDLDKETLAQLAASPVNRLSIGTQSFLDRELRLMNRAHSASQALVAIENAKAHGFTQLNIDLIYGIPGSRFEDWQLNVDTFLSLDLVHLSSYCLTVEPGTALAYKVQKGTVSMPEDDTIAQQYTYLHNQLESAGYRHYEISNFARPGFLARHNTSYWRGTPYLGVGPAAHSFQPGHRQWNVAHNPTYIKALADNRIPCEQEVIDSVSAYNEYLLTGLRTDNGISLQQVELRFGTTYRSQLLHAAKPYLLTGQLIQEGYALRFNPYAWLVSDGIISDLFQ